MYEAVLLANALLWCAITFYYVRLPVASAFHPLSYYLFFHGFIFALRPIVVHWRGYTTIYRNYQFTPSMDDKITTILGAMLGLACFTFFALRSGYRRPRFAQDAFTDIERERLKAPYLLTAALFLPPAVMASLSSWNTRSNDSTTMVLDAATGIFINTTGNAYSVDIQLLIAPFLLLGIWLFRFRWWTFAPFAAFIILRGGTGGRWPILMACATLGLMFLYDRRRAMPNLKAIGLAAAALLLFELVGLDRGATIRKLFIDDNSRAEQIYNREPPQFLEAMDFANLEFYEYLVYAVPQRTGTHGYFLDNLQVLTEPVPRVLWPGKPIGPPIRLFTLFDHGYPIGMTYSLPGEGWMQFGYPGVAIWCSLFGWFYGWVYSRFQQSRQSTLGTMVFLLFLPLSLQFFRDGLLLTLVKTHAWFLLPLVLVFLAARLTAVPLARDLRQRALHRARRRHRAIPAAILARRLAMRAAALRRGG